MKQFLNKLTNTARDKNLPKALTQFAILEKFLDSIDASYVVGVLPYVQNAAQHFELVLTKPPVNDNQLAKDIEDMQKALRVTAELQKRLDDKTQTDKNNLAKDKQDALEIYNKNQHILKKAMANKSITLSVNEIVKLNQETTKMLEAFGDKNLPKFVPTTAKTGANNNAKKWGATFLDAFSKLFEGFAKGSSIQDGIQSFAKSIVGFLTEVIGNFFFNTLGKDDPDVKDKVDNLGKNVEGAFDRYMDFMGDKANDDMQKKMEQQKKELEREQKAAQLNQFEQFKAAYKDLNNGQGNAKVEEVIKKIFTPQLM